MERAALTILIPQRNSALRLVPWRWWHVAVGLAPLLVFRALSPLVGAGWLPKPPGTVGLPLMLLGDLWMLGWPLLIARRYGRVPRLPDAEGAVIEAVLAVPAWLMLLGVIIVASLPAWRLGWHQPPANPLEKQVGFVSHFELVVLALSAVLIAPVAEETFFRGMLYNALRRRLPLALALLLQAVIFGFLHAYNLTHSVLASLLGIGLGLVYEWRRTLVTSAFVHALQNALAVGLTAILIASALDSALLGASVAPAGDGCRIVRVAPYSAADEAGLRADDVLTAIDGTPVPNNGAVNLLVRMRRPGDVVAIDFRRDGEAHHVEATLKRKGW